MPATWTSESGTVATMTISTIAHHGGCVRHKYATIAQIAGINSSHIAMLLTSSSQMCAGLTGMPAAANSLTIDVSLATITTASTTRNPQPCSRAIRRCVPFNPCHPPLVPATCAIVPVKPPSAPLRYRSRGAAASQHASQRRDRKYGTALRHGLAAERRVRAADPLSYRHGVRAMGLSGEDRPSDGVGRHSDAADQPVAAHAAVRRIGLCQQSADCAFGDDRGDRAQPECAAVATVANRDE